EACGAERTAVRSGFLRAWRCCMAQSSGRVSPARMELGPDQFAAGPSGGRGGDPFVDPAIPDGATIARVRVRHGAKIDAIRLAFRRDGRIVDLPIHGGNGGTEDIFNLDVGQVITGFSGSYDDVVCQFVIQTNQGPSPSYGRSGTALFNYTFCPGLSVIGLFGRSARLLDALGCQLSCGPQR